MKHLILVSLTLLISFSSFAAITATPASGGTNINNNLAADGSTPGWTTLGVITMTEGLSNDFGTTGSWNVFININTPTGWSFNVTATPTLGFTAAADVNIVTVTGFTATSLSIRISGTGNTRQDAVTVTGLQVEATSTSSASGNMYATIGSGTATGIVTGIGGTNFGTLSMGVSVITGATSVCTTSTTSLSDATPGGIWTSSNTSVATVGTGSGLVTGITAGSALISYTVSGSTVTTTVTVSVCTPQITGNTTLACIGSTTHLSDVTPGGIWSSSDAAIATIGSSTGIATAVSAGSAAISYTVGASVTTTTVTVNPLALAAPVSSEILLPPSSGCPFRVFGSTAGVDYLLLVNGSIVTDIVGNGGNVAFDLYNYVAGNTYAVYAVDAISHCTLLLSDSAKIILVTSMTSQIMGDTLINVGAHSTLTDSIASGSWTSADTGIAVIGSSSGIVTGIAPGTTTITYLSPGGCKNTTSLTVGFGVGIQSLANKIEQVEIYPNPATTSLTISSTNNITNIVIANLIGQTVYTHEYSSPQVQVNVAGLSPGIYLVKINNTEVRKFVKE